MTTPVFPIQPVTDDGTGVLRFVKNELVSALLDHGQATGFGLNELAKKFNKPEHAPHWQQLAQLIGYSMSGYGELSYVDDESYDAAMAMYQMGLSEDAARNGVLRAQLIRAREGMRDGLAALFECHRDDFGA